MLPSHEGLTLRPYQVLCAVCALGESDPAKADAGARALLDAVRKTPDLPITLRCNVGEVFAYQDPGTADDTPGGAEFNLRRDLEILLRLNLTPGDTLPARIIFNRVLEHIEDVAGICTYGAVTADAWRGCPRAASGNYARGRAKGSDTIIPPRTAEDMQRDKADSLAAMDRADPIDVRPHILLCAVCQYGLGIRPPYPEDNLPELIQLILKAPDTRIRMAPHADWMMCAPCPSRAAACNACVHVKGTCGVSNQLRDLRVLQTLGLTYGAVLPARELYRRIFERIPGTLAICRTEASKPSLWWSGCGFPTVNSENYEKGRKLLMAELG